MSKIIWIIVIIVLAVLGYMYFTGQEEAMPNNTNTTEEMPEETSTMNEEQGQAKEFVLEGKNFSFTPNMIEVNQGDAVSVTLRNTDTMPHDFRIDELNAATRILNPGESQTITFTADTVGEFEFYCSVGNHRARGMVGTFKVN